MLTERELILKRGDYGVYSPDEAYWRYMMEGLGWALLGDNDMVARVAESDGHAVGHCWDEPVRLMYAEGLCS